MLQQQYHLFYLGLQQQLLDHHDQILDIHVLKIFCQNPAALTKLGKSLAALGQQQDACVTLGEVATRFPGAPEVGEAAQAMATLGCG